MMLHLAREFDAMMKGARDLGHPNLVDKFDRLRMDALNETLNPSDLVELIAHDFVTGKNGPGGCRVIIKALMLDFFEAKASRQQFESL